jgi:hypothetical protein
MVQLILADLKEVLCKEFDGLKISISALQRHLVQKCRITLKKLEKIPAARCSDRVVALHKSKVEQWQQIPDLDFTNNCVFVDEAGFNLHIQRNRGRFEKGQPAKGIVPTGRGVMFRLLSWKPFRKAVLLTLQ